MLYVSGAIAKLTNATIYNNTITASLKKLNCCSETEVAAILQVYHTESCKAIFDLFVDNIVVAYSVILQSN